MYNKAEKLIVMLTDLAKQKYETYTNKINNIIKEFKELTSNDIKLKEHFKDTPMAETYTDINTALYIVSEIHFKNITKSSYNVSDMEEIPYSEEQQNLIIEYECLAMSQSLYKEKLEELECRDNLEDLEQKGKCEEVEMEL